MLQSIGSLRGRHDLVKEQQPQIYKYNNICIIFHYGLLQDLLLLNIIPCAIQWVLVGYPFCV